jgi:hypothetical protein
MRDDTGSLRARLGVLPIVWTSPLGRFTLRCTSERGRVMACTCALYGEEPHLAEYTGDAEYDAWHNQLFAAELRTLAERAQVLYPARGTPQ